MPQAETQTVSTDQAFYDQEFSISPESHKRFITTIGRYFNLYAERLNSVLPAGAGVVAELGAGSCGLSLHASTLSNVSKVYALDISQSRMDRLLDASVDALGTGREKVELLAADFNQRLPFDDKSLDVVLFDASLHHSRAIWNLLGECHRVVRDGGVLVAQRESYLSPLRASGQIAELMKSPEVAAQVSENMYLKSQYEYYLSVNGFDVEFIPLNASRVKSIFSMLNGTLFTDGVLWCPKKAG